MREFESAIERREFESERSQGEKCVKTRDEGAPIYRWSPNGHLLKEYIN